MYFVFFFNMFVFGSAINLKLNLKDLNLSFSDVVESLSDVVESLSDVVESLVNNVPELSEAPIMTLMIQMRWNMKMMFLTPHF